MILVEKSIKSSTNVILNRFRIPLLKYANFNNVISGVLKNTKSNWKTYLQHKDKLTWEHSPIGERFACKLLSAAPVQLEKSGVEIIHLSSENVIPIYDLEKNPYIITRTKSRGVMEEIFKVLSDSSDVKHAILFGNPGIGKSVGCLLYILKVLLEKEKLVYYHLMGESMIYAFVPPHYQETPNIGGNYQVFESNLPDRNYAIHVAGLHDPNAFYLVDVDEENYPILTKAHTIIASSPDDERFKLHKKRFSRTFYLSMWTLEELKALINKFPNLCTAEDVEERFLHVNGNLRAILSEDVYKDTVHKQIQKSKHSNAIRVLYDIVFDSNQLLLQPDKRDTAQSTSLFAYSAEPPYLLENTQVQVISQFIMNLIISTNYEVSYRDAVYDTTKWERFCILAIAAGGVFEIWDYQNDDNCKSALLHTYPIALSNIYSKSNLREEWKKLPLKFTNNTSQSSSSVVSDNSNVVVKDHPRILLAVSDKTNFPLIDFVTFRDMTFNPTIAKGSKKLPTAETILDICETIGISTLHLYHCVPEKSFDTSKKSIPKIISTTDNADIVKQASKVLKQYVLKIPTKMSKVVTE